MKKWIWVAWGTLAGIWLFGAGLLIGRAFPAHHYERFGNYTYLFDASTGRICDTQIDKAESDPFAAFGGRAVTPPPDVPKNADGYPIVKPAPSSGAIDIDTIQPCDK